jgi:hypothetical protein
VSAWPHACLTSVCLLSLLQILRRTRRLVLIYLHHSHN